MFASQTKSCLTAAPQALVKKYLVYKAVPINVAIIRGTTADPTGNVPMECESLYVLTTFRLWQPAPRTASSFVRRSASRRKTVSARAMSARHARW